MWKVEERETFTHEAFTVPLPVTWCRIEVRSKTAPPSGNLYSSGTRGCTEARRLVEVGMEEEEALLGEPWQRWFGGKQ